MEELLSCWSQEEEEDEEEEEELSALISKRGGLGSLTGEGRGRVSGFILDIFILYQSFILKHIH